jgi:hypothetical protein
VDFVRTGMVDWLTQRLAQSSGLQGRPDPHQVGDAMERIAQNVLVQRDWSDDATQAMRMHPPRQAFQPPDQPPAPRPPRPTTAGPTQGTRAPAPRPTEPPTTRLRPPGPPPRPPRPPGPPRPPHR